jgi:hypothetical protein
MSLYVIIADMDYLGRRDWSAYFTVRDMVPKENFDHMRRNLKTDIITQMEATPLYRTVTAYAAELNQCRLTIDEMEIQTQYEIMLEYFDSPFLFEVIACEELLMAIIMAVPKVVIYNKATFQKVFPKEIHVP